STDKDVALGHDEGTRAGDHRVSWDRRGRHEPANDLPLDAHRERCPGNCAAAPGGLSADDRKRRLDRRTGWQDASYLAAPAERALARWHPADRRRLHPRVE